MKRRGDRLINSSRRSKERCLRRAIRRRIPILFTISVLLGAIAFPGLRKDRKR